MILALAYRLEASVCDPAELDTDVIHALLHMPELHGEDVLIQHLHGLVGQYRNVEALLRALLPTARYSTRPAIVGFAFHVAAVDTSGGRHHPEVGIARSKSRALLAATLRAYVTSDAADHQRRKRFAA